jgi:hypothetical protein
MRPISICSALVLSLLLATPAFADATLFAGSSSSPAHRQTRGLAVGLSKVILGFEFEYASTSEDSDEGAPSLRTGMGNVLLQTPLAVAGFQPYVTAGAGAYRERLGTESETQLGVNSGGGLKITIAGPLRARVDYRMFRLAGNPLHPRSHRLYAGLNVKF